MIALGASDHHLGLAAASAAAAAALVAGIGALVARQLSEVPENSIKTAAGIMLTSFGLFWIGEGAGAHWPGADLAILVLIALFSLITLATTAWLRQAARRADQQSAGQPTGDR